MTEGVHEGGLPEPTDETTTSPRDEDDTPDVVTITRRMSAHSEELADAMRALPITSVQAGLDALTSSLNIPSVPIFSDNPQQTYRDMLLKRRNRNRTSAILNLIIVAVNAVSTVINVITRDYWMVLLGIVCTVAMMVFTYVSVGLYVKYNNLVRDVEDAFDLVPSDVTLHERFMIKWQRHKDFKKASEEPLISFKDYKSAKYKRGQLLKGKRISSGVVTSLLVLATVFAALASSSPYPLNDLYGLLLAIALLGLIPSGFIANHYITMYSNMTHTIKEYDEKSARRRKRKIS